MAFTSGEGFAPYLLDDLANIALQNTPGTRLDPFGTTRFLYSQNRPEILRVHTARGHKKRATVKYRKRLTKDETRTTKECDGITQNPYLEQDVELVSERQIAFLLEDDLLRQYQDAASSQMNVGTPQAPISMEMYNLILSGANAILHGINEDLLTDMVTKLGTNVVTTTDLTAGADTVNISTSSDFNDLNGGLTQILSHYSEHGGIGRPQVIGGGNFHNMMLKRGFQGPGQNGLNTTGMLDTMDYFYDLDTQNILGANQILVLQPDAYTLVDYLENIGNFVGPNRGDSYFGVINLPMMDAMGMITPVTFDYQLKWHDCATMYTDDETAQIVNGGKGWVMWLRKCTGVFAIPADAYRSTDRLFGHRGALRYEVTNTCESCPPPAAP